MVNGPTAGAPTGAAPLWQPPSASICVLSLSATMTVVAREVTWKMPRKLGNVLNYKYVLLTRLSEGLFEYIEQRGFGRFLIGRGRFLRNALLGAVQRIAQRQLLLDRAGLVRRTRGTWAAVPLEPPVHADGVT